jgi:2-succinyl-6-hydroxy-2,4-cyclohexadiene-1-carboxylate synthase
VLTIDLPGHGHSPVPDPVLFPSYWSLDGAAERIHDVLQRLGIEHIHLVGYSMGARAAMAYARQFSGGLVSLTLVSGNPGIEDDELRSSRRKEDAMLAEQILDSGLATFVREWGRTALFHDQQRKHTVAWRKAQLDRRSGRAVAFASSLLGSGQGMQKAMWQMLRDLELPLFVVAGALDEAYTGIARRIAAMRDARLLLVGNCGHDIPLEAPEQLAATLEEFWVASEKNSEA